MKRKRHTLILELIQQYEITTQDELLAKLRENGFEVTQATVSRDIKELRLVKAMSPSGQYRYMVSTAPGDEYLAKFYTIFSGSVISVDFAGNTCVLKCYSVWLRLLVLQSTPCILTELSARLQVTTPFLCSAAPLN